MNVPVPSLRNVRESTVIDSTIIHSFVMDSIGMGSIGIEEFAGNVRTIQVSAVF